MNSLKGQTALVTGASQGIGLAIAEAMRQAGAIVHGMDIVPPAGQVSFTHHDGDVASASDVARIFSETGPIDILVNNAAITTGDGLLHEVTEASWDRVVDVCLKSVFLCSKAALPAMIERRRGVILSLGSVNALTGIHLAAYTAAKGGILSLTRLLAQQYGRFGIRANAICPGTILTESSRAAYNDAAALRDDLLALYPAHEFGAPADIAECAVWLASAESRFINGTSIVVDGGMSAVHRLPSLYP